MEGSGANSKRIKAVYSTTIKSDGDIGDPVTRDMELNVVSSGNKIEIGANEGLVTIGFNRDDLLAAIGLTKEDYQRLIGGEDGRRPNLRAG